MIIKNILSKICINKVTYIIIFISLISGLYKELLSVILLLFFHELGHIIISLYYKWNIKKIIFYPFGGLIIYEDEIDKPLFEEFMVSIMGLIFQEIIFFICFLFHEYYYISDYFYNQIYNYNISIFIFNLLPIIPLDGYKIFNILLNKLFCFRKSYIYSIYLSIIFFLIYFFKINDNIFLVLFLIYEVISFIKNKNYIFTKFLVEKRMTNNYSKIKKINSINNMFRNKKHIIKKNNTYITEKTYFKK